MADAAFLTQAEFARRRKVSRKAVTTWKAKGLLVIAEDGRVNVEETEWNLDQRPKTYRGGVTHRPIKAPDGNNSNAGAPKAPKAQRAATEKAPRPALLDDGEDDDSEIDLDSPNLSIAEAVRRKENHLGLLRRQEFEAKGRALVDRAAAERQFFEVARDLRDAWLAWPARVAVLMASELSVDARTLTSVLTAHVHQHLTELGEAQADFARD